MRTQIRKRERLDVDLEPRPLPGVSLLPSAATLGNLLCGVLAVFCCLLSIRGEFLGITPRDSDSRIMVLFPSYIVISAYLIVLAMIFDALDGRLARITRRTSEFGSQLDSVADIVSFGTAPVLLYLTLLLRGSEPADGQSLTSHLEWQVGLVGALVYVSCAAIRLARFNAENIQDATTQKRFSGLPVPGAAAAVVAVMLLHADLLTISWPASAPDWAALARGGLGPLLFVLGLLMVSRLDYVHVFNVYVRRQHPPTHLVWLVAVVALAWYWMQILLVLLAFTYVLSGIVLSIRRRLAGAPVTSAAGEPPIEPN
jgi:CDP-diacylglycerol--serine O-phosphatidyltransferase